MSSHETTQARRERPDPLGPAADSGWRHRLHEIVFHAEDPSAKAFDVALIGAILASVAVVVLSTADFAEGEPARSVFWIFEWIFTGLFAAEYALRIILVRRPLRYIFSFFGIIDLLAILPGFLGLIVPGGERLLVVRAFRLLRIFRVLKLTRYLSEANNLRLAIMTSWRKIAVFITVVLIVVLTSSAVMHVIESAAGNEDFESMPNAIYWAIITMTTVGYGDITPQTGAGRVITAMLVLTGYSLIIVPTGIFTAQAVESRTGPLRPRPDDSTTTSRVCPSCSLVGHDADALHCRRCGHRLP